MANGYPNSCHASHLGWKQQVDRHKKSALLPVKCHLLQRITNCTFKRKRSGVEPQKNCLGVLHTWILYCETTKNYCIDSKTIKNGKGNGNFPKINSKTLTDGNRNFTPWHKTIRQDFGTTTHRSHVLPESQSNTSHTSTLGGVLKAKPVENPTRCHKFQTMKSKILRFVEFSL